jgi:formate dehydrogenase major subunit
VHQIGLPYHWGGRGLVRGDSANELISFVADPNVSIQESKALTGNIQPGRRRRGPIDGIPEGPTTGWRDRPAARHKLPGKHGVVSIRSMRGEET